MENVKSIEVTKEDIRHWRKYFENGGVLLDVPKIKELRKKLRMKKRTLKKDKSLSEQDKAQAIRKIDHALNSAENLVLHSEEFLATDALESGGFFNESADSLLHLYPSYTITDTHRLMSETPCISNLSPVVRSIVTGGPDYNLLSIDFRHQEPWIIINLLDDKELLAILTNYKDFYLGLLAHLNVPQTEENRSIAKIVWNASIYGASLNRVEGLSDDIWVDSLYSYINERKSVISLREKVCKNIRNGKPIYTRFGLERTIDTFNYDAVLKGFNSIFQMSGAGVLYTCLYRIEKAIQESTIPKMNWSRIYLTLHDEFILKVPKDLSEQEIAAFIETIDFSIEGWTTPRIKWTIGEDWGEAK